VGVVTLVVLAGEIKELKRPGSLPLDFPEEERPNRKPLHQAVEEAVNLLGLPNEFPLNGGQHIIVLPNPIESGLDCDRCLVWHVKVDLAFLDRISESLLYITASN
jgi:hypothetical protein